MERILLLLTILITSVSTSAQNDSGSSPPKNLFLNGRMGLSERNFSEADSLKLVRLSSTASGSLANATYVNLADYAKSDGSDQYGQIQQAVNAAQTQSKPLYIPTGVFCTSKTIVITSSNVTIFGNGNGSIIKALNTSPTPSGGLTVMRVLMQVNYRPEWYGRAQDRLSNIYLHDYSLDMSAIIPDYQPGWNDGIIGRGALYCASIDHLTIEKIFINKAVASGITVTSCFNTKISQSTINGLRAKITDFNIIYDGNGININTFADNSFSYTGPIGNVTLDNCTVIGDTGIFSTSITNNVPTNGANIGIQTNLGNPSDGKKLKNVSITNCKVLKWYWAIMAEGMDEGGAGDVLISHNTIDEAVNGIWLFGNSKGTASNSKNAIISGNRIKNIHHTPISIWGIQSSIQGNHITNWAIAPATSELKSVSGLDGTAAAIYILPHPVGFSEPLIGSDYIVSNNICINEYINDGSYAFSPVGIWLRAFRTGQILNNMHITGNLFDLGKVSHISSLGISATSGVLLDAKITNANFSDNTVSGAGFSAIMSLNNNSSDGIENFVISNNRFVDNNFASNGADRVIRINTSNTGIRIESNEFLETYGARMMHAILITGNSYSDVAADNVTIRNNKIKGIGDGINVFVLNTTGTNITIEGNENYNYRSEAPVSTYFRGFKGTMIFNKNVAVSGIYGWLCTVTGNPGTWAPMYIYNPSSTVDSGYRTSYFEALGNGLVTTNFGLGLNEQGAATSRNVASSNFFRRRRRIGYTSSTTNNTIYGLIGNPQFLSSEGFSVRFVFGIQAYQSGHQYSVGIGSYYDSGILASKSTQCIQLYADAGDSSFKIKGSNNSPGAVIELGAKFPCTSSEEDIYDVTFTVTAGADYAKYTVKRLNTGDVASGTVTTVPLPTVLLALRCVGSTNLSNRIGAIDIVRISVTTDN